MKETEAQRRWRLAHPDYYREYNRRYRLSHPGVYYAYTKKWRLSHPKKRHLGKKRYYRRMAKGSRNSGSFWSAADIELVTSSDRPSDRELHEELGRSVAAIQMARCRALQKAGR